VLSCIKLAASFSLSKTATRGGATYISEINNKLVVKNIFVGVLFFNDRGWNEGRKQMQK
jgi:hypothetical protein